MFKPKLRLLAGLVLAATWVNLAQANAPLIGVLTSKRDNFRTLLINNVEERAHTLDADLFLENANSDSALQLRQYRNLIAAHVDAVIVNLIDDSNTQQMLALARARDAGAANSLRSQFAHVDVVVLVEEVIATLWPLARAKQIDLGLELNGFADGQERRLLSVEWLLREAISNLVDNAIRYTPRHGQVTLQVIGHATSISLVVIDSGGGMSDHDRERAGSRFRRGAAGKHQQGAGLGLAIVQTIAGMHGAELTLSNGHDAQGKLGLHCRFRLPRAASDLGITPK